MNCEFAEKVSMLIDGELPKSEVGAVTTHIAGCAECREMQKYFLFFRVQIKETAANSVKEAPKIQVLSPPREWWKKEISIPVPVLALILLIISVFGGWVWRSNFRGGKELTAAISPVSPAVNSPAKTEQSPNEMSLARFDKGRRAEIYIAPAMAKKAAQ